MPQSRDEVLAYKRRWWQANRERWLRIKQERRVYKVGRLVDRVAEFNAKLQRMTEPEIAYLAGLLDGEGTVMIHPVGCRSHANADAYLQGFISICNTDKGILDWLGLKLPGRLYWQDGFHPKDGITRTKRVGIWRVHGKCAALACERMLPYLQGAKRKRAQLLIELFEAVNPRTPGRTLTTAEILRRCSLMKRYRSL